MTVHLLGLCHTQTTKAWSCCAFTQKVVTLASMLQMEGRRVVVYSGEENDAPCDEHVVVATEDDRRRWFGDEDYRARVFDRWDINDPCWTDFNQNIIAALRPRVEPRDVISLTMGLAHRQVADAFPGVLSVELGVGYEGSFGPFRVFESYAWQHFTYGRQGINDGRYYDAVIPNAYDPGDFGASSTAIVPGYFLFIGRHTERKGLEVIRELAKHVEVVSAGQEGPIDGIEYRGVLDGEQRAAWLRGATAVIVPTGYIEPFGGVAVEAQLCGTPVITTDWGAFPETVEDGVTGYRCRTLGEFVTATEQVRHLDRGTIARRARDRWSLAAVAPLYGRYLDRLDTLYGEGWYELDSDPVQ